MSAAAARRRVPCAARSSRPRSRVARSWCCRWSGCWSGRPGRALPARLTAPGVRDGAAAVAGLARPWPPRCRLAARRAAGLAAGPGRVPRPVAAAGAGDPAAGAAAGGRRRGAAARARPARPGRAAGCTTTFGITLPFTTAGGRGRRDVRGDAVPGGQPSRARCAPPTPGSRRPRPPSAPAAGRRSAGSRCRWSRPASRPARCCAGPGRWASSARRSPSPATSRARRRPCRWPSTWRWRPTPTAAIALSPGAAGRCRWPSLLALRDRWLAAGRGDRHVSLDARPCGVRPAATVHGWTSTLDGAPTARWSRVLGPNGAGKTTLLRALAGLLPLDGGRIELDGEVSTTPAAGISCRRSGAGRRGVPGLPALPAPDRARQRRVRAARRGDPPGGGRAAAPPSGWSGSGSPTSADRRPRQLSGGQAQRVALARALAGRPRAAAARRAAGRARRPHPADVRGRAAPPPRRLRGRAVLVTHDPLDALVLADRLVVVEDGRVVQEGDAGRRSAAPARAPTTWPGWSG